MKILVLGASGMLGHKLVQRLSGAHEVVGSLRGATSDYDSHEVFAKVRLRGGVRAESIETVAECLADAEPALVINCIGIVKQRDAATQFIPSLEINALFPHRLAALCQAAGSRMIHFSTDCVFSGNRGSYTEEDPPDPQDLYGRTKLLGEVEGPGVLTLRTSIVGRELAGCQGLFEWFIHQRGGAARGYTGAIYSGLTTLAMADLIGALAVSDAPPDGLWHVASEPISKYDLLAALNRVLGLGIDLSRDTTFRCDRSLDSSRFHQRTGWRAPSWDEMVEALAADPTPYS